MSPASRRSVPTRSSTTSTTRSPPSRRVTATAANIHEFELTGRDTALVQAYRGRQVRPDPGRRSQNGKILNNVVQEIDIKTGAVLMEWNALGTVGLKASETSPPEDGGPWDYLHINATKADGDSVLISGRRTSTIYRVPARRARSSGGCAATVSSRRPTTSRSGRERSGATSTTWSGCRTATSRCSTTVLTGPTPTCPVVNDESSILILKLSGKGKNRKASLVKRYTHEPDPVVALVPGQRPAARERQLVRRLGTGLSR